MVDYFGEGSVWKHVPDPMAPGCQGIIQCFTSWTPREACEVIYSFMSSEVRGEVYGAEILRVSALAVHL